MDLDATGRPLRADDERGRVPTRPQADEPLEPVIATALEPVLRDLRGGGGPIPTVADDRWGHPELQATAMLWGEAGAAGISVSREDTPPQRIVSAADGVQDWAVEESWRHGRAEAWPPCPAHPSTHPLRAELRADGPAWCCPRTGEEIAAIGALRV